MSEAPPPVAFLLGVPRSGTTLLSLLLNQHAAIFCPQEPWLLLGLEAIGQTHPEHPADAPLLAGLVAEFLGTERRTALKSAAHAIYRTILAKTGKTLLVDKTPRYYHCLELLDDLLEDSRGIWLQRNPLDVAASYFTSWNVSLPDLIRDKADSPFLFDYLLGFRYLAELSARRPLLAVRYENLVRQPALELARVFEHLGLAPCAITTYVDQESAGYAQSAFADKKIFSGHAVHTQSIDSYKNVFDRDQVALLLGALGQEVFSRLGYADTWHDACATFAPDPLPEGPDEYFATAERYRQQRKTTCQASLNTYQLTDQLHRAAYEASALTAALQQSTESNTMLQQQLAPLNAANADLAGQVTDLAGQVTDLGEQLHALQNRGGRARVIDLLQYARRRLREIVRSRLWRLATGKPPAPLPRITLVTPVFNGADHIAETLESVLRQDYPDLEYIVVDGGSTDGTLDILKRYQAATDYPQRIARIIAEPDHGMYDAIAKGLEEASGEIQCYMNADDTLLAGGLRSVGAYFAAHPDVQIVYHEDVVQVDGWRYPNVRQPEGVDLIDLLDGHILFQDGVFWRRGAYQKVGGFRRDLKLAGDFDLWLRMAAHFSLVRRPGHVSCFRIRPGQLSEQMESYHKEMRRSIDDLHAGVTKLRRLVWHLRRPLRRTLRRWDRKCRPERLFFPIDFGNLPPPPVEAPPVGATYPISPIDGKPAERLLFSTPDTRFGDRELNYIYLDERHGIAITHPPIPAEKLDALYRRHYSTPPTELKPPLGASPYRRFNGRRLWEKALLRLPVEKLRLVSSAIWQDPTLAELMQVLDAAGIATKAPLRFLDTGCFEGHLLDQIRVGTAWQACGLEPNETAVAAACAKGHTVWQGHAEHAGEIMPADRQFDVIFLGQSIEHVDDPVRVLRRLRLLLAPGGALVLSTPNLDAREIDWCGPTWAHWHPPYHRFIFSRRGMVAIARRVGLAPVHFQSFSHPYWTTMTLAQNGMGLGGSASHAVNFERSLALRAQRINFWQKLIWNPLGQGDYFFMVLRDDADE